MKDEGQRSDRKLEISDLKRLVAGADVFSRQSDGSTIAGDARRSGFYYRTYPQGPVAPQIVGYDSARYGQSGIEASLNGYLSGADAGTQGLIDRLLGRHTPGANVRLTIVPAVQKVAQSALGSQTGAIVALDPITGFPAFRSAKSGGWEKP